MKKLTALLLFLSVIIFSNCKSSLITTDKSQQDIIYTEVNDILADINYKEGYYSLEEEYYAPGAKRGVIIISEPHLDIKGQRKLYYFLESLNNSNMKYDLSLYCVEGSNGEFNLAEYRSNIEENKDKYYLTLLEGKLSGWEYYSLMNKNITVLGIENIEVYKKQIMTFSNNYNKFDKMCQNLPRYIFNELLKDADTLHTMLYSSMINEIYESESNGSLEKDNVINTYLNYISGDEGQRNTEKANLDEIYNFVVGVINMSKSGDYSVFRKLFPNYEELDLMISERESLNLFAKERDIIMAKNTISAMGKYNKNISLMFIGNFHRKGITDFFKNEKNVSFIYLERTEYEDDKEDEKIYLKRLKNEMTVPPSYLKPIIYEENKDKFENYINELEPNKVQKVINRENLSKIDIINDIKMSDILKKKSTNVKIYDIKNENFECKKLISGGASGNYVYKFSVKDGLTKFDTIVKQFKLEEKEKVTNDINNTKNINETLQEKGLDKIYPEYYLTNPLKIKQGYLVIEEAIDGLSLKDYLEKNGKTITKARKSKLIDDYLNKSEVLSETISEMMSQNQGKLNYVDGITTYRQLFKKIEEKLEYSKKLNDIIYKDNDNMTTLIYYYDKLEEVFNRIFNNEKSFSDIGVVNDCNMGNYFPSGKFIDSVEDEKGARIKMKAVQLKDIFCTMTLKNDKQKNIENDSNELKDIIKRILKNDLTEEQMEGIIGFVYLFDMSDNKMVFENLNTEEVGKRQSFNELQDSARYELLMKSNTFFTERDNKNYLVLLLLKIYNEKFNKDLDLIIQQFLKYYENKITVENSDKKSLNLDS